MAWLGGGWSGRRRRLWGWSEWLWLGSRMMGVMLYEDMGFAESVLWT